MSRLVDLIMRIWKSYLKQLMLFVKRDTDFVISHDLEFLSRVATKAVFIENNTVSKRNSLKKSGEFETIKRFLLQSEVHE